MKLNEERKQIVWRGTNAFMALFFFVAACLQINDPDPVVWMCLYGITCLVSLSILITPQFQDVVAWRIFVCLHLVFCASWLCYVALYYGHVINNSNILHSEEGRELSGSILVLSWLAITLMVSMCRSCTKFCSRKCELTQV